VQDCSSSSSDIDIISSDHNSNVYDEDIDVVAESTPDNNSTDDTSRRSGSERVKRTVRSKWRKQLLTERPAAAEFSEVSCTFHLM